MSSLSVREICGKNGLPVNFPNGVTVGSGSKFGNINYIGLPGQQGFGVGICPNIPTGFSKLPGTDDIASDNYGNYQYSDGSVMCWIPAFYYKIGTGSNGLAINVVDVKGINDYANESTAIAAGYALHRAFYNAGMIVPGVFVDKYQCSNSNNIASSIKNGNPLSSAAAHNPFAGLTGAPSNAYHGAIVAAKTRGANFFCNTVFIFKALALLSLAHGQAAASATSCAWYDAAGIIKYPKGNNNNALKDSNDTAVTYISDGYSNCGKTGSANFFSKTTHNGQNSGVCDLNGNMWEIGLGLTSDGSNFYILKTSVDAKTITSGTTLATDAWGATGIAAMYDNLGATYESLAGSSSVKTMGAAAAQVFSGATSGNAWNATGAGIPLTTGVVGTNMFGNDGLWDYRLDTMCPLLDGNWANGASAGVWTLYLYAVRTSSTDYVGFRSALYL